MGGKPGKRTAATTATLAVHRQLDALAKANELSPVRRPHGNRKHKAGLATDSAGAQLPVLGFGAGTRPNVLSLSDNSSDSSVESAALSESSSESESESEQEWERGPRQPKHMADPSFSAGAEYPPDAFDPSTTTTGRVKQTAIKTASLTPVGSGLYYGSVAAAAAASSSSYAVDLPDGTRVALSKLRRVGSLAKPQPAPIPTTSGKSTATGTIRS